MNSKYVQEWRILFCATKTCNQQIKATKGLRATVASPLLFSCCRSHKQRTTGAGHCMNPCPTRQCIRSLPEVGSHRAPNKFIVQKSPVALAVGAGRCAFRIGSGTLRARGIRHPGFAASLFWMSRSGRGQCITGNAISCRAERNVPVQEAGRVKNTGNPVGDHERNDPPDFY